MSTAAKRATNLGQQKEKTTALLGGLVTFKTFVCVSPESHTTSIDEAAGLAPAGTLTEESSLLVASDSKAHARIVAGEPRLTSLVEERIEGSRNQIAMERISVDKNVSAKPSLNLASDEAKRSPETKTPQAVAPSNPVAVASSARAQESSTNVISLPTAVTKSKLNAQHSAAQIENVTLKVSQDKAPVLPDPASSDHSARVKGREPVTKKDQSATSSSALGRFFKGEGQNTASAWRINSPEVHSSESLPLLRGGHLLRSVNSAALYKLGNSFYEDVKNGVKCFAFTHVDSAESQKRSILGIASFISYFEDARILILTNGMANSFYAGFASQTRQRTIVLSDGKQFDCPSHVDGHITYVETSELSRYAREAGVKSLSGAIKQLVDEHDVVLFDLPSTMERSEILDAYFPMIQSAESVTFTVSLRKSRFSEVNQLMKYFHNYKVKIKGSIVDHQLKEGAR